MSIFVREKNWSDSPCKVYINLPLRNKQKKDVDILQTTKYLKVHKKENMTFLFCFSVKNMN